MRLSKWSSRETTRNNETHGHVKAFFGVRTQGLGKSDVKDFQVNQ
jgi:hypothetical protein